MPSLGNEAPVSATAVWLTPPSLLSELDGFDLDPCAASDRPWDTAKLHYTKEDDGLAQDWHGRVWLNPPYGPGMDKWLKRLAEHPDGGIALIFARTETKTFFEWVWERADALLFIKGRLKFHKPNGEPALSANSPSVLIAYGKQEVEVLKNCGIVGKLVEL